MAEDQEFPEGGQPDLWAAHLPGRDLVPAYLVSRFAAQYRAIVDVLLEAQDRTLTGVSHDEIGFALRAELSRALGDDVADRLLTDDGFPLDARLDSLFRWGVLTRWQDPARTGEDFLRRRDRYQLTPAAARLHSFWTREPDVDEDVAADLTLAPRAIRERLEAFAAAVRGREYPAAANEYQQLMALHQAMASAARTWQRGLAHALSGGPDPEKQEVLWRTLKSYIGLWGEQVDTHTPRIAVILTELSEVLTEQAWQACVRAAGDADDPSVATQAARWARTWTALSDWFSGPDAQARRLRRQLRDLVAPWARDMHILLNTGGTITRRNELLELARAIEQAPGDEDAWRIWDTAVGVFPARHLLLPAPAPDEASRSWAEAPPAPVTARFREQGVRAAVGRRAAAMDYSAGRTAARRARAAVLASRREAEASLRARSGSALSDWDPVSGAELDLLLELLAIARRTGTGTARTATTADGRWRVGLSPPARGPATTAVRGPDGRLITLNWHFVLEPAG